MSDSSQEKVKIDLEPHFRSFRHGVGSGCVTYVFAAFIHPVIAIPLLFLLWTQLKLLPKFWYWLLGFTFAVVMIVWSPI